MKQKRKEKMKMQFTQEQRERIDKLLHESDEMQKQEGSKYYTTEEVWGAILEQYHRDIQSTI